MAWLGELSANIISKNLISSPEISYKVIKTNLDFYKCRRIYEKERYLTVYSPLEDSYNMSGCYDIVVTLVYYNIITVSYSVYRSNEKYIVESIYKLFKDRKLGIYLLYTMSFWSKRKVQKVCDTIREHPGWSLGHIAAHLGDYTVFGVLEFSLYLNCYDPVSGMSPLMVAVLSQNKCTVASILRYPLSYGHLDYNGNTVFHWAVYTNREIYKLLMPFIDNTSFNFRNKRGDSPLSLACKRKDKDMIQLLLLLSIDHNNACIDYVWNDRCRSTCNDIIIYWFKFLSEHDMQFGGNPLHWALTPEATKVFLRYNAVINGLNFQGRTPLHMMVLRNRLKCVIVLLSRGADPNIQDCNGETALHTATRNKNITMIQALISFDARLDVKNNDGAYPRHLVRQDDDCKLLFYLDGIGAPRCPKTMKGCTQGCHHFGIYRGVSPTPANVSPICTAFMDSFMNMHGIENSKSSATLKGGRVLCLDGGGVRGIILTVILLELEKYTKKPIRECFDWIAGTSTGGILALGLVAGKSLYECLRLYFKMKDRCFVGDRYHVLCDALIGPFVGLRPYSSSMLEKILKNTFGAETKMNEYEKPKVMVSSCLADRSPVELHWFRNYPDPNSMIGVRFQGDALYEPPTPDEEVYMWQAGRASGAAPTYFRAYDKYLDGGLVANNPTLDALTEIHKYNTALQYKGRTSEIKNISIVISIGTGISPITTMKNIDLCMPSSLLGIVRVANSISNVTGVVCDQLTESNGRIIERCRAWCSQIGVPYFRLNPQLSEYINLNETDDRILVKMIWETKVYLHEYRDMLKVIAEYLTK